MDNLTPEQRENTIEEARQGNGINNINQPVQQEERFEENENFVVENKEANEEEKTEILEEFFKAQNMNIKEQNQRVKPETNKKNKFNIMIGNIALDQIIKDIKPKYITTLNELTYATAKTVTKRCGVKKKNRNRTTTSFET